MRSKRQRDDLADHIDFLVMTLAIGLASDETRYEVYDQLMVALKEYNALRPREEPCPLRLVS